MAVTKEFEELTQRYIADTFGESQCDRCVHRTGNHTCKAFPDGIPFEIIGTLHDHSEPFDGDNGIRFEEK